MHARTAFRPPYISRPPRPTSPKSLSPLRPRPCPHHAHTSAATAPSKPSSRSRSCAIAHTVLAMACAENPRSRVRDCARSARMKRTSSTPSMVSAHAVFDSACIRTHVEGRRVNTEVPAGGGEGSGGAAGGMQPAAQQFDTPPEV
eukprot:364118-Chlamydomonas_euryale.AAC.2